MSDTPSADDLARENAKLRKRNGELEDGLRTVVRRQAAAEAGLDPDMARWIKGDTVEDAVADAKRLADQLAPADPWARSSASPEADAIQQHLRESHDAAAALNDNQNPQEG
ncbi:MAG TPA: hypothetical protein VNL97_05550 [Solirubrobacterales bacterium]|nr:hypothetical protein [Solirubrobacterales bacterium]